MTREELEICKRIYKVSEDFINEFREFKELTSSEKFNDMLKVNIVLKNRIIDPLNRNQEIRKDIEDDIATKLKMTINTIEIYLKYKNDKSINQEHFTNYLTDNSALEQIRDEMKVKIDIQDETICQVRKNR